MNENMSHVPQLTRVRINENGRIVIPAAIRAALGMQTGEEVILSVDDDELRITTLKSRIARAQRYAQQFRKPGESVVDEFLAERREAARHE